MSAEYRLAFNRGNASGYQDGLESIREPYPHTKSKAEWAGYKAGYDEAWERGYQAGINIMLKQYVQECKEPPHPRLLVEIINRQSKKPFLSPDELDVVLAIPSHLKDFT
jgi:ribosome modulation factor